MPALGTFNVTKENRATVSKTLLLSIDRMTDYYQDSEDGLVTFYYEGLIRRRSNTVEYKSDLTMDQFRVKVLEEQRPLRLSGRCDR